MMIICCAKCVTSRVSGVPRHINITMYYHRANNFVSFIKHTFKSYEVTHKPKSQELLEKIRISTLQYYMNVGVVVSTSCTRSTQFQSSLNPSVPRSLSMNTTSSTRISNTVSLSCVLSNSVRTSRSILVNKFTSWLTSLLSLFSSTALTPGSSCSAHRRMPMLYNVL